MPRSSPQDRRQSPRIAAELAVKVTFLDNATGRPLAPAVDAATVNLSMGGLCARLGLPDVSHVTEKLLTDQIVARVALELAGGRDTVFAFTRVAWCERGASADGALTMGLAFRDMSPADREKLVRFLKRVPSG